MALGTLVGSGLQIEGVSCLDRSRPSQWVHVGIVYISASEGFWTSYNIICFELEVRIHHIYIYDKGTSFVKAYTIQV